MQRCMTSKILGLHGAGHGSLFIVQSKQVTTSYAQLASHYNSNHSCAKLTCVRNHCPCTQRGHILKRPLSSRSQLPSPNTEVPTSMCITKCSFLLVLEQCKFVTLSQRQPIQFVLTKLWSPSTPADSSQCSTSQKPISKAA